MSQLDVADYRVIRDEEFDLFIGGDIDQDFEFDVPSDLLTTGRAIISWNDRKEGSGTDVDYEILLNGTNIRSQYTVSAPLYYTRQEAIPASRLTTGNNTLEVRVLDGTGRFSGSDFCVHFRRRVDV